MIRRRLFIDRVVSGKDRNNLLAFINLSLFVRHSAC